MCYFSDWTALRAGHGHGWRDAGNFTRIGAQTGQLYVRAMVMDGEMLETSQESVHKIHQVYPILSRREERAKAKKLSWGCIAVVPICVYQCTYQMYVTLARRQHVVL